MTTRVLIVAALPGLRADLRTLLELVSGVTVAGEAGGSAEAERLVAALTPDLALIDLDMPAGDGFAAVRALRSAGAARWIAGLTADGSPAARADAARAGVDAFALKGSDLHALLETLQANSSTETRCCHANRE